MPFRFDAETLSRGLNFTLSTTIGAIDLLGELPGGTYDTIISNAVKLVLFGEEVNCISLSDLTRVKRAAGRPKDFEAIAELELLNSDS